MKFLPTPLQLADTDGRGNRFFIKREDLLPYSFGGNKVRIGLCYLRDFQAHGCTHLVAYGNARSNLCRVLANLCAGVGVPLTILSPADDDGERRSSFNERLCRDFGACIIPCLKTNVAESVDAVLSDIRAQGGKPYYIYGDRYGRGNEAVPTAAYVPVYDELRAQGAFDVIALACGTGMTQAGLLCGQKRRAGTERVIGLSVAREAKSARAHILDYANAYLAPQALEEARVEVCDTWRETYGCYDAGVAQTLRDMMRLHGIPLDGTYTGKAYCALRRLCEAEEWRGKDVLFIHTGGTPLFFDSLESTSERR